MDQSESSYDFEDSIDPFLERSKVAHSEMSAQNKQSQMDFFIDKFEQMDKEKKGKINKQSLKQMVMFTGQNYDKKIIKEEIEKCQEEIDFNRFVQIFEAADVGDRGINQWLFKLYDKDRKGYISDTDLIRVSEITGIQLSEQEVKSMLTTEGNKGNGKVGLQQFKDIMSIEINYL